MTEEELQYTIWQAVHHYQVTCAMPTQFVDTILRAARRFATTEGGITAERRRALLDALDPPAPVHLAAHYGIRGHACRARGHNGTALPVTSNPGQVTCNGCKRTRAYAVARATQGAVS